MDYNGLIRIWIANNIGHPLHQNGTFLQHEGEFRWFPNEALMWHAISMEISCAPSAISAARVSCHVISARIQANHKICLNSGITSWLSNKVFEEIKENALQHRNVMCVVYI